MRELNEDHVGRDRGGGRYPEHELWDAVYGYLDLLRRDQFPAQAQAEPRDLTATRP